MGEITRFNGLGLTDDLGSMHNILRPETIESVFLMWRTTKSQIYRNWGQRILAAFSRMKAPYGYAGLHNVNKPWEVKDDMPSFFVAETLKYLFLLFADESALSLDDMVLNTEAHPLPTIRHGVAKHGMTWTCGGADAAAAATRKKNKKRRLAKPADVETANKSDTGIADANVTIDAAGLHSIDINYELHLTAGLTEQCKEELLDEKADVLQALQESCYFHADSVEAKLNETKAELESTYSLLTQCSTALAFSSSAPVQPPLATPAPSVPLDFKRQKGAQQGALPCWVGAFTFERCCIPPPHGNPGCWDGDFTFGNCCVGATEAT